MLVVQTNNATFGYTAESEQQVAIGRLRAVEHRRSLVVAATSGIGAIIGPDGGLVDRSALVTADTFVRDVAQRGQLTVATRLGSLPEWSLSAPGLTGVVVALGLRVRSRSRRKTSR